MKFTTQPKTPEGLTERVIFGQGLEDKDSDFKRQLTEFFSGISRIKNQKIQVELSFVDAKRGNQKKQGISKCVETPTGPLLYFQPEIKGAEYRLQVKLRDSQGEDFHDQDVATFIIQNFIDKRDTQKDVHMHNVGATSSRSVSNVEHPEIVSHFDDPIIITPDTSVLLESRPKISIKSEAVKKEFQVKNIENSLEGIIEYCDLVQTELNNLRAVMTPDRKNKGYSGYISCEDAIHVLIEKNECAESEASEHLKELEERNLIVGDTEGNYFYIYTKKEEAAAMERAYLGKKTEE